MELERLNSSEESKPKVCTKLFPRYNSDSCISTTTDPVILEQFQGASTSRANQPLQIADAPLIIVSKENVLGGCTSEAVCQKSTASTSKFPITKRIITPITKRIESKILIQNTTAKSIIKLLPVTSVPAFQTIQSAMLAPTDERGPIARYKIDKTSKPKVINLSNFDPKKLIPIQRSDIKLSLAPVTPIVLDNTSSNNSFAILTRIQAPIVSPGDTFKAVKIGNTLQLVPMRKCNNNNNNNRGNFSASS